MAVGGLSKIGSHKVQFRGKKKPHISRYHMEQSMGLPFISSLLFFLLLL